MSRIKRKSKTMVSSEGILCSDLHLRDDIPVARVDDYWEAQSTKLLFILDLSTKYDCDIFISGDFFNRAKSSQYLEQWAIKTIRGNFCSLSNTIYVIPGQHDLPNHNINLYDKSSLAVLEAAGVITVFKIPYDDLKCPAIYETHDKKKIAMIHTMVYEQHPIHENVGGTKASKLLKKYRDCDIVLTGDNHMTFTYTDDRGRSLVNPGGMMRMDADQIQHKPSVFMWYSDNSIERIKLPVMDKNAVTREHIEKKEYRNAKMQTFIKRIGSDYEVGISFRKNMKTFLRKNKDKIKNPVKELVWRFIDGEE